MITLLVAVAPVIVLIVYILVRDKYEREPIGRIILTFFVGMLAVPLDLLIIAIFGLGNIPSMFSNPILQSIGTAFFSAAIPEEISKLAILFLLIWRNKNFNEKMDGIVYAVCVSMGFACVENILYVMEDPSVAFGRAIFAVPGHFLDAVLMGYFFSLVKFMKKHKISNIVLTILAPILAHGLYDAILMVSDVLPAVSYIFTIIFIAFNFLLWRLCLKKINEHVESSPF